jgi:hypothetical protein
MRSSTIGSVNVDGFSTSIRWGVADPPRHAGDAWRRLLAEGSAGVGYLLKDRVADVGEFVDALARVAAGGTALDPVTIEHRVWHARQGGGEGGWRSCRQPRTDGSSRSPRGLDVGTCTR